MREILFRGKRTDNGDWIEGYYACIGETPVIFTGELDFSKWDIRVKVNVIIPETVGQYTGLTDKNGKRIFEGDIIKSCEYDDIYAVKYFGDDNYPAFDCVPEVSNCECNGLSFLVNVEGCEVIGNIYDNPELLENNTRKDKSI